MVQRFSIIRLIFKYEIEFGATQIDKALGVHDQPDAVLVEYLVGLARLVVVPLEEIRKTGAATAANTHANGRIGRAALLALGLNRLRGARRYDDGPGPLLGS